MPFVSERTEIKISNTMKRYSDKKVMILFKIIG